MQIFFESIVLACIIKSKVIAQENRVARISRLCSLLSPQNRILLGRGDSRDCAGQAHLDLVSDQDAKVDPQMKSTVSKAPRGVKCHYVSKHGNESIKIIAEYQASCQELRRGEFNAG
jgi:hypothetical protein